MEIKEKNSKPSSCHSRSFTLFIHIHTHKHTRKSTESSKKRSSCCDSAETNLTSILEGTGLIPGLTQWVKDLAMLAPTAPIQPLPWEPAYVVGVALKGGGE